MIMMANSKLLLWLPLVLWMAVILHFSITPQIPGPVGEDISYLHVPVYFILSGLFLRLFLTDKHGEKEGFFLAIVVSTLYGVLMEALQFFTQVRFFDYIDMMLNFAGSCIVLVFVPRVLGKFVMKKP
jgi:VanZ family protein